MYADVRDVLTGVEDSPIIAGKVKPVIDAMDKITTMDLPAGLPLYRGMMFDDESDFDTSPGTVFTDQSFTSMSTDLSVAHEFTTKAHFAAEKDHHVIVEMVTKEGAKGVPIDLFNMYDVGSEDWAEAVNESSEGEVVLPRGQSYKILSSTKDGKLTRITVESVDPDEVDTSDAEVAKRQNAISDGKAWSPASGRPPTYEQLARHMVPQMSSIENSDSYDPVMFRKNVNRYKGLLYSDVRDYLSGDQDSDAYTNSAVNSAVKGIVSAMDELTTMELPEGIPLFRGMLFKNENDFNTAPGTVFTDASFTSMSTDSNVAEEFTTRSSLAAENDHHVIVEMVTGAGDTGAPIELFNRAEPGTDKWGDKIISSKEREVVLPRGQSYRILTSTKDGKLTRITVKKVNPDEIGESAEEAAPAKPQFTHDTPEQREADEQYKKLIAYNDDPSGTPPVTSETAKSLAALRHSRDPEALELDDEKTLERVLFGFHPKPLPDDGTVTEHATREQVTWAMRDQLADYAKSADSIKHQAGIDTYQTSGGARVVRSVLSGERDYDSAIDEIKGAIDALDFGTKMVLPENITLYRGMAFKPYNKPFDLEVGVEFTDSSYASTSLSQDSAEWFAGTPSAEQNSVIMRIKTGSNTRGMPTYIIGQSGLTEPMLTPKQYVSEQEVTLRSNSRFRITGVEEDSTGRYYLDVEVVSQDGVDTE